jgi:hypothetical protein
MRVSPQILSICNLPSKSEKRKQQSATSRPRRERSEDNDDGREREQVQTWNDHLYANGGGAEDVGSRSEAIQHLKRTSRLRRRSEDEEGPSAVKTSQLPTVAVRGRGQEKREIRDPGNYQVHVHTPK